jgi:hypothetical protein
MKKSGFWDLVGEENFVSAIGDALKVTDSANV